MARRRPHNAGTFDAADVGDVDLTLLLPESVRRTLERRVLVSLAGFAAEELAPSDLPRGYRAESPLSLLASEEPPAALSATDRHLLARGDTDEPLPNDVENAYDDALALTGDERLATLFLRYLAAEAERLVRQPLVRRRIARLAEALLEHGTLGAAQLDDFTPRPCKEAR